MPPAMRCDLVTRGGYLPDDVWMPVRDPAECEECRMSSVAIEQLEYPAHAQLDPTWDRVPLGARHHILEQAYLEVFLHVDREEMTSRALRGGEGHRSSAGSRTR